MRKKLKRPARGVPGASEHKGKLDATSLRNNTARPGEQRPIAEIQIGARHRKDLGDVDSLAASIADIGLLHPVVVTPSGKLVAGERRLAACKRLGRVSVPVHVVDIDAIVRGELAENADRKDFTPSELVAIAATVEERERELAKQRQAHGGPRSGKLPERSKGDTRDKVAAPLGVSGRTLERARAVVRAAEAEPEQFGDLLANMDRTGRVNGNFKRLKIRRQAQAIRAEPPPLPGNGPYRVLVVDPPWPYDVRAEDPAHDAVEQFPERAVRPYPEMTIEQIKAFPVASIAHDDSILWLWTTNFHMRFAFDVLDAWGFAPQTILTWVKDRMALGVWLRCQTEQCILATRGRPTVHLTNQTTVLHAPMRAHSEKPQEFFDLVEALCPAPRYAELFSRQHRDRWDGHGDEAMRRTDSESYAMPDLPEFLARARVPT